MLAVRYAAKEDETFWFTLDRHLTRAEYDRKVREKRAYILLSEDMPVGLLRYNLFWDSVPFCTMLWIAPLYQHKGFGRYLTAHWEQDMKALGHGMVMTSTQADESAQHFYRRLGYQDAGGLILQIPGYEQPTELFFVKELSGNTA